MANGNIKIDAHPDTLAAIGDILGTADPDAYQSVVGTKVPTVDPNLAVSLMRRPGMTPTPAPTITGLNSPLTLTPYQRMSMSINPQPQESFGPPMRGSMLGPIPSATNPSTITPTIPTKSFFGKVGGVLGKIGHVAGKVGEIAGDALAPEVVANIPGTALNKEMLEHQQEHRDDAAADNALTKAKTDEAEALAAKNREGEAPGETVESRLAEFDKLFPGVEKDDPRRLTYALTSKLPEQRIPAEQKPIETEGGKLSTIGADNVLRPIMMPAEKTPPITLNSPIPGGTLPLDAPIAPQQAVAPTKPSEEKEKDAKAGTVNGKPAWAMQTPTGWVDVDTHQPVPNFKPAPNFAQTGSFSPIEVNLGGQIVPGSFNARTGGVTPAPIAGGNQPVAIPRGTSTEINKNLEGARGADTRFRVMKDAEQPALNGNQQAMLNILSNHLGMTMGLQKGARITQAVWNEAQSTTPFFQKIVAKFDSDGYLSGVTLTPTQIRQMIDLGQDRRVREWQQASDAARQNGIDISGEIPNDVKQTLGGGASGDAGGAQIGSDEHFQQWMKNRKK